jgi:hypothetical protein
VFDRSGVVESSQDDITDCGLDASVALASFTGAVIGAAGCFAAALISDTMLSLIAGFGATICAWLWHHHLIEGDVTSMELTRVSAPRPRPDDDAVN